MGCGQSKRAGEHVTEPLLTKEQEERKRPKELNKGKQRASISQPAVTVAPPTKDKEEMATRKESKEMADIEINPSQFVLEKSDSIYHNYSLKEKIGEGAFGIVYKAVHKVTQDRRAIKFIDKSSVSPEKETKLFQEINILKQLDHPHIVKLYEFYSDSKYYYMVTELVEGGELFDEIQKRKGFSEEAAADIISQLLSAIVYCHERKIVHRDLKPENVLIETAPGGKLQIKVIDFGTAQTFSSSTKLKTTMGTPYYIAPEVLLKSYNEKCDVWSCGVILYILLSGTPPFNGATDEDIMKAVKKTKFSFYSPVWQDISDAAKDLISKMLKFPPETRISAQEAYTHEWIKKKKFNQLKPETAMTLLTNLKNFHTEQKLQQAALMYIVTQLMSKKEKDELQQTFMALDKNADGKLSREELIEGYTTLYGNSEIAIKEVDVIMGKVDVDHNGFIDYSEFLLASANKAKVLSKDNLKRAFKLFDKDGSGFISADEIKLILGIGKRFSEDVWAQVVGEVDQNSDGQISYDEFEKMMGKFLDK